MRASQTYAGSVLLGGGKEPTETLTCASSSSSPCTTDSYATRLLGSQLSPSLALDDQAVLQGIHLDLQAQGKSDMMPR